MYAVEDDVLVGLVGDQPDPAVAAQVGDPLEVAARCVGEMREDGAEEVLAHLPEQK